MTTAQSLDVSMHAFERFCERVLDIDPSDLTPAQMDHWCRYIAEQAALDAPFFNGIRDWRKTTKEATYAVVDLMVATVLVPGKHWRNIPLSGEQREIA